MSKWHKRLVGNSPLLISVMLIIALMAITGRSGSIQTLGGLAVAGPGSSWINVQDVSVGSPIKSGAAAVGMYLYNGTNYDIAKGDATNGMYVNVKSTVAPVGAKTPADAYAVPTDGLDELSFMMGFNGTTYDRMRSIANNADAVAVTTLGIYPTGSYLYGFNGTSWDRTHSVANNADAVAVSTLGNIAGAVYDYLFNGTTWDRKRSAGVGNNVASTGLEANVPYVKYQTTPTAITNNNHSPMLGDSLGRPMMGLTGAYTYTNIVNNQTSVVLSGAGYIHTITINTKGATGNTATIYDNTAGSGTKIGTIDTTVTYGTLIYDAVVSTGITIVTATGTAPDMTVTYKAN